MLPIASNLPDDVDALRAIIVTQARELAEQTRGQLATFRGVLHADGYAGFRELYEPRKHGEPALIREAACMAHARRKFLDLTVAGPAPVAE